MSEKSDAGQDETENRPTVATIRRAPKLAMFLVIGGGLGAIVTFILTALYPVDEQVGFGALFGYFALYGVPLGVLLGAIVALILDWRSRRAATTVAVEHENVHEPVEHENVHEATSADAERVADEPIEPEARPVDQQPIDPDAAR